MCMDDNADAKRILLASPPADWRRQLGRPSIMWLSTVQQDLKQHHLTLSDVDVWRYAIVRAACQKWRRRRLDITWPYHVTGSALSVVEPSLLPVRRRQPGTRYWTVSMTWHSAATASDYHWRRTYLTLLLCTLSTAEMLQCTVHYITQVVNKCFKSYWLDTADGSYPCVSRVWWLCWTRC